MGKILNRAELLQMLVGNGGHTFVMMAGCQGSGKSTLAKALQEAHEFKRLSLDRMAKKMAEKGELNFDELERQFFDKLRKNMRSGVSVVDDNLNLTRSARARTLKAIRGRWMYNATRVVILHMDAPLKQCLAWNKLRKNPAASFDVEWRWNSFRDELPDASEGNILRVRPMPNAMYEILDAPAGW